MRKLYFSLAILFSIGAAQLFFAQNTYNGDVTLSTQAGVESFASNGYTAISGFLRIGSDSFSDISDLSPLSELTTIGTYLKVDHNDFLTSLIGLHNVNSVGGRIIIGFNQLLANLNGLNGVASVGGRIRIENNLILQSLAGLESLTALPNDLIIANNLSLKNLAGLQNITSITGDLIIENNNFLFPTMLYYSSGNRHITYQWGSKSNFTFIILKHMDFIKTYFIAFF